MKEHEDIPDAFIHKVRELREKVGKRDDYVGFDSELNVRVQKAKQQVHVLATDLGGDAHELAEGKDGRPLHDAKMRSFQCTFCGCVPSERFLSKGDQYGREPAQKAVLNELILCDVLQVLHILLNLCFFAASNLGKIILLVFVFLRVSLLPFTTLFKRVL